MIILVNAGTGTLSHEQMDELMRKCEATTWYQILVPEIPDEEAQEELALDITTVCAGDLLSPEDWH